MCVCVCVCVCVFSLLLLGGGGGWAITPKPITRRYAYDNVISSLAGIENLRLGRGWIRGFK